MKDYLIIFLTLLLISCNLRHDNHVIDKIEAEKIANQLYYHLQMEEFDNAEKLFGQKAFEISNREDLKNYFKAAIYQFGNVKNFVLDHWETSVQDGSNPNGQYIFFYYVTRQPKHTFEKLYMEKENDSIKIISYEVTLDSY